MSGDQRWKNKAANDADRSAAIDDLRRMLSRFGARTDRKFKSKSSRQQGPDIDILIDGEVQETDAGSCFRVTHTIAPQTLRGTSALGDWLFLEPAIVALVGQDKGLEIPDLRRFVFLDTETTGLGMGAVAFMVGIGFFNETGDFEIQQYFMRNRAEEFAMLTLLHKKLQPDTGLVTFNGCAFDIPLLGTRYTLNRITDLVSSLPNFDLLRPARRLWRRRLSSCALNALERDILELQRDHIDVPGYMIPALYQEYLHTGDAREMVRVFYHNEQDLLSMVTLGIELCRIFAQPDAPDLHIDDRLSLARWYHGLEMIEACESAYRIAIGEAPDKKTRHDALFGLAMLLKRGDRRAEAVPLWESLADLQLDVFGHVELAKYYEWYAANLLLALDWTEAAMNLAQSWRPDLQRKEALAELEHRRNRLLRKIHTLQ